MKPLMYWQGNLLFGASLLVACVASAAWAEPVGNANFSQLIRNNPSGHFELKENVYLNGSPWTPFPSFNGTLDGSKYAIYGLHIEENRTNANSGLFIDQSGAIRDLVFIHPELEARSNGVYLGLVAGENSGNVTGIVWQGGRMEHTGAPKGSRYPLLGVVGKNLAGGRVEAVAQGVNQTATGNYARIGIGAGLSEDRNSAAQGLAQAVNQTAMGNSIYIGIGAGRNKGTAQGVAQAVTQTAIGSATSIGIGIGAGINWKIAQGVAQDITQTGGNPDNINIGAGRSSGGQVQVQGIRLTEADKAKNLNQLNLTTDDWTSGTMTQYPMLVDLNGGFQDMRRLSSKFMGDFASPSNNPDASWFSSGIRTILERLSVPCGDLYCLFTASSPGAIRRLLYDGQRYHGFVRAHDDLTYWAVYEKDDSRVSLEP